MGMFRVYKDKVLKSIGQVDVMKMLKVMKKKGNVWNLEKRSDKRKDM